MTTKHKIVRPIGGRSYPKDIRREGEGWGVTVCFGDRHNYPTAVHRHIYGTRRQARAGDISIDIGQHGRIA